MFSYPCPYCGAQLTAPADHAGERTLCTKCLRPVVIPDVPTAESYRVEAEEPIPLMPAPAEPQAIPALAPAGRRSWAAIRFVAAGCIVVLAFFGANAAARYFSTSPEPVTIALERAGAGPVANLRSALNRRDSVLVVAALYDLAETEPTEHDHAKVIPEIKRCVTDSRPEVRAAARAALVTWAPDEARTAVIATLGSMDGPERRSALGLAARLPDPAVAAAVAARLSDRADRAAAAETLVRLGVIAVPAIVPLLTAPDRAVVLETCDVLGRIGGPEARKALAEFARATTDPLTRMAAERTLKSGR